MKRTILLLTLTSLAGVSFAEEYIQPNPLATWANGSWDTATSTTVSTDGNWTMRLSLNASALMDTFKPSSAPTKDDVYAIKDNTVWKDDDGRYVASDTLGKGLFSLSGSSYQQHGSGDRTLYENQKTTVVMGWGNDWYASRDTNGNVQDESYNILGTNVTAGNGVAQGLQLGFSHTSANVKNYQSEWKDGWIFGDYLSGDTVTLNNGTEVGLNGTREGYDMGAANLPAALGGNTFDVYRADTKLQKADGWTIEETGAGAAKVDTLDAIVTGATIQAADLVIVHSTNGAIESSESFTTLYLTVTLTDGQTLRYMAEINDASTYADGEGLLGSFAGAGEALGGSAYYDIDNFTIEGITNINNNLIDFIEVYDKSHWVTNEGKVMPEPTTATLSLMALAALAARRRRR